MNSVQESRRKILRPDRRSLRSLLRRTILLWDLAFAALLGLLMLIGGLIDSRFKPTAPYFIAGAAASVAIAAGAFVAQRWGDRSEGAYGEVIRTVDPEETAANLPYAATVIVGLLSTLWCAIGAIIIESISDSFWGAIASGLAVFLASYTLLAFMSLVILTFRHQQRISRMRFLEERSERVRRSGRNSAE